jgi:hypothetical protein
VEDHIIERNVAQFSHAGETPFVYSDLGKELGHTGDYPMAEDILEGSLDRVALLGDPAIRAIVDQLKKLPLV